MTDQLQGADTQRSHQRSPQRARATGTTRSRRTGQVAQAAAQAAQASLFPAAAEGVAVVDAHVVSAIPARMVSAAEVARTAPSLSSSLASIAPTPVMPTPQTPRGLGMGAATVMPGLPALPRPYPQPSPVPAPFQGTAVLPDPEVWLVATATANGGMRPLEGMHRSGAIRVERPYGHLRAVRPVLPPSELEETPAPRARKGRSATSNLPANRPAPAIISAVEVETDSGIFRVQRPQSVLGHSDLAWALANLEAGEPDAQVPLPRRQLALLLTLLPTPEDPEHPENDPTWGWAHRLKGPWERGPLHTRGRLGRLISIDPDPTGRGMHRACFELLGSDEVVWALGVPCFRTGSVYELVPLSKSRFMSWPLVKSRAKGSIEHPAWEISRVVYRVGNPRWPLAGVVEPLGPIGTAG